MGRRALRKIDPSIDLSRHLKTFDQLPRPWDAARLFGRMAPLEVEVGSGKGLFLRRQAAARAEVDLLGIEVVRKYAAFTAAALAKADVRNAMVVHADALRIFAELIPDQRAGRRSRLLPRPVVEEAAQEAACDAPVVRARRRADARAWRIPPFLDRRSRVFRDYASVASGTHDPRRTVAGCRDSGRI